MALAQASRHPLSVGLRRALENRQVRAEQVEQLTEEPGFGVRGMWHGLPVSLGRPATEGATGLAAAFTIGERAPNQLHFSDALRPEAVETVQRLRAMGIESSIVSGDSEAAVAQVATAIGIKADAGLRPEAKVDLIQSMTADGAKVLMVGDGLNDGPALAAGHVSMAPASASDVGQSAADAVFMGDSLAPVATAIAAARRTMRIVRQNLVLAIAYNAIAVPLALFGLVTPLVAAVAMSSSSLIVVGNALRLRGAAR
jgi:Cu2+-exporting ATPase